MVRLGFSCTEEHVDALSTAAHLPQSLKLESAYPLAGLPMPKKIAFAPRFTVTKSVLYSSSGIAVVK